MPEHSLESRPFLMRLAKSVWGLDVVVLPSVMVQLLALEELFVTIRCPLAPIRPHVLINSLGCPLGIT